MTHCSFYLYCCLFNRKLNILGFCTVGRFGMWAMINTIVQYLLLFYKQNDDVIIKIMVSCSSEGMQQTQSHYLHARDGNHKTGGKPR